MVERTLPEIHRRLARRGFRPSHVAEVGVWRPEVANVAGWIDEGVRATLVEPDPAAVTAILRRWGDRPGVAVHAVAVFREPGRLTLARRGPSTFVSALDVSPAIVDDRYRRRSEDLFEVEAVTFDAIDDGTIDLLCVDVEGCEWYVLERLRSRPRVLAVETHGAVYVNPHLTQILDWVRANGYVTWYVDGSDTVFVRRGAVAVTPSDRVRTGWNRLRRRLRRARKRVTVGLRRLVHDSDGSRHGAG